MTGMFITFEGGEGSGKSTQVRALAVRLAARGHEVLTTREPGGTPEAEKIRALLVDRDGGKWSPLAEAMLLFAARTMHVETLIKPALAAGKIVLCDRFADSTRAYQGYGHGLPLEVIEDLNRAALGDFAPRLTFILDIDPEQGLNRSERRLAESKSHEDRFERLDFTFHKRLRQGYLEIAKGNPQRCHVVEAAQEPERITGILEALALDALGEG